MDINYFKVALSHHSKGNWNKAQEIYQHLLKEDPNNYVVLQNYGPLLAQLREYKLAKDVFIKCLKIKPNDSLLLYNYGKFFHDQKNYEKAIEYYNKSFENNPKNAMSQYNIGNIYFAQKKFGNAIEKFKKAASINPAHSFAYNNIGLAFKKLGNFNEALKFYKKAIDTNKDFIDGHINYGTLLLLTNKLELGFKEYEWRKKSKTFSDYLNYSKLNIKSPVWLGQNLERKTILIFSEQGIGDLIQFSRYLFALKETFSCNVILRLKQNLAHLFDDSIEIITENDKIPNHDFHNHLASLPGIFYKKNKNFPKTINFIKENKDINLKWKEILNKYKGIKVGINSTASSATTGDRIIPIEEFRKLTNLKNINFFVIQKDFNKNNIKIINQNLNVNYFEELDKFGKPFQDTIGLVKNLDLIITADTSLGHLSATLGKPTWIALSFINDWRWFQDEKKSVWYETVKLFKQKKIGNWGQVFELIYKDLEKKL
tara:strand:- start:96 stop:1550 length:1455 start_codon:yes stop_codon:yes gene_type:complete